MKRTKLALLSSVLGFSFTAHSAVQVTLQKIVGDDRDAAGARTTCTIAARPQRPAGEGIILRTAYTATGQPEGIVPMPTTFNEADALAKATAARGAAYTRSPHVTETRPNVKYLAVLRDSEKGEATFVLLEAEGGAAEKREGDEAAALRTILNACD